LEADFKVRKCAERNTIPRATRRNRTGDLLISNADREGSTESQDELSARKDDDHEGP
jgi:hypothetical protein